MPYKYRIIVLIAEKMVESGVGRRSIREEIARYLGISYSQFNRLNRAKEFSNEGFTQSMLHNLANYFGVPVEELFNNTIENQIPEEYHHHSSSFVG